MEKTTFNISEVARLTGKARSTINNHLRKGKLSCIYDSDDNKLIEASEIIRAYGDHLELDGDGKLKSKTKRREKQVSGESQNSEQYHKLLKVEQDERARERNQLETTIEHLRQDLEKSQEREIKATRLLEHQSKDTTDRFAAQMADIKRHIAKQDERAKLYRSKLAEERNKTFWQRLFG